MALIKCKECGKSISDTATMCPHCGIKIKENKKENKWNLNTYDYILFGVIILIAITNIISEDIRDNLILILLSASWYFSFRAEEKYKYLTLAAPFVLIGLAYFLDIFLIENVLQYSIISLTILNKIENKINIYDIIIIILAVIYAGREYYVYNTLAEYDIDWLETLFVTNILLLISLIGVNLLNKLGYKDKISHVLIILPLLITIIVTPDITLTFLLSVCAVTIISYVFVFYKFKTLNE